MRRLRSIKRRTACHRSRRTSARQRNDPVCSRRPQSSVQVHDRSARRNLFVFLLMWESSGLSTAVLRQGFPEAVLRAYGAKLNYLIDPPYNQWWRFITPMFIHIDVLHLLMNMFSLLILGPFVEKLYGSAKFVVFWVVTGIAGVVGSYLTVRPQLADGLLGSFIFHKNDCACSRRIRRAVWIDRRSVRIRNQISSRTAGRLQARVWHGHAANHLYQPVYRIYRSRLHRKLGAPQRAFCRSRTRALR